jgi:heme/copper-type cytochrome/quinol oxidase subunit 2
LPQAYLTQMIYILLFIVYLVIGVAIMLTLLHIDDDSEHREQFRNDPVILFALIVSVILFYGLALPMMYFYLKYQKRKLGKRSPDEDNKPMRDDKPSNNS